MIYQEVRDDLINLNLQLNLHRIMKLDIKQQDLIIKLFDDLMNACYSGGIVMGNVAIHPERVIILYNTLSEQGWLVNSRDVKLTEVLTENLQ